MPLVTSTAAARLTRLLTATALALALAPSAAHAERAAGLTGSNELVTFDTATPGSVTVKAITGVPVIDEHVIGLDLRPATGELMALTVPTGSTANAALHLYKVDPNTAAASLIGSIPAATVPGASDRATGLDFNPLVDRLRVVEANNENFRVNPNNATLSGDDTTLTYMAPATGPVTAVAYDRNIAPGPPGTVAPPTSKTTLYGIDTGSAQLVLQGGIDGTPSANNGVITAVGPLGVPVLSNSDAGFDISSTGTAYAALTAPSGVTSINTVNLATGAATQIGDSPVVLHSLTILPPDNCPTVDGDDQADLDSDGIGDACDPDIDGDGLSNTTEASMGTNPRSADTDGDGKADGADSCPTVAATTASGCPDPPPPVVIDKTAPSITITKLSTKLKFSKFLKGVSLRVKPSEAASLLVELIVKPRNATVSSKGDLVLDSKNFALSTNSRPVKLKPKRKLVAGRKKFTVTVRVTATDAAGNRKVVSKTVRISR